MHLAGISCHDTNKLAAVVLQSLEQCVDGLRAEGVIIPRGKSVCLVDEQHASNSRIHQLVGLYGCLSTESRHQFRAVGLNELSSRQDTESLKHICHNPRHGGLTRSGITREDIVLALECFALATLYLQIEEGGEISDFLLHTLQSDKTVKFLETVVEIHCLGFLVRHILWQYCHEFLVTRLLQVVLLKSFGLTLAYCVKELAHGASVGEVLVTMFILLANDGLNDILCLWRDDILLVAGKAQEYLVEFLGRIIVDIQEIVETALESGVDAEEIVHLHTIARRDHHKVSTVVLHALHQCLKGLGATLVAFARLIERSKGISLIHKEYSALCLVAKTVDEFGCLALILAHHL